MLSKIYLCPADKKYGCTWEGISDEIYEHFREEHEDLLFFTGSVNIPLDVTSENRLLLVDTEIYLLQTKICRDYFNIYLRFLGPSKIASCLTYEIEISANGIKMGKQDIEICDGYFRIALECIYTLFGDVNTICCKLLVSGDFSSNSSNDSVFIKEKNGSNNNNVFIDETDNLLQRQKSEELTSSLEDFFCTSQDENSPIETRQKKVSLDETNRATWHYAFKSKTPKEHTLLTRSQTFSSEDLKRNSVIKRHASMRSLGSIAESDLDSELKCSNCESHLAPPIFLCITDHNICVNCYRNNKTCSLCDKEITADRNEELEEKSINYLYSCTNKKNGCSKKFTHREILDHEINCMFCLYLCPIEECYYKAGYKAMISHLNLIHSSVKMFQSFIAIFQKYQELFLVNETMGIFYCTWVQIENKIVWKAKFCGPKSRKFFCELKFKGKKFKTPLLLTKHDDYYFKEMEVWELKEQKIKPKHSILAITG